MLCIITKSRIKKLLRGLDSYLEKHIDAALKITGEIKKALSSPTAGLLLAIIPGNEDINVRNNLVNALDSALAALSIFEKCREHANLSEKLNCMLAQLHQQEPQLRDAMLQKLASLIAGHLDGNRMRQSLYDLYTQAKYSASK